LSSKDSRGGNMRTETENFICKKCKGPIFLVLEGLGGEKWECPNCGISTRQQYEIAEVRKEWMRVDDYFCEFCAESAEGWEKNGSGKMRCPDLECQNHWVDCVFPPVENDNPHFLCL